MPINLTKGSNISLAKEAPTLVEATIGLGWDARSTDGKPFDLDASAFLLGADGRALSEKHFVFYNEKVSPDGSVRHTGDNRTGAGDGDDEQIIVDLRTISPNVDRIVFTVTIHDGEKNRQTFGQVSNAYIRLVNNADGQDVARYDLQEDASSETAMIFAELYRKNGGWSFRAVGQGYAGGLAAMAAQYGLNAA